MCGGCGAARDRDWASGLVVGPRARAAVAASVTAWCRRVGVLVQVSPAGAGWTVASPTGAVRVAATVTELWAAVPGWARLVAEHGLPPLAGSCAPGPEGETLPTRRVAVLCGVPGPPEREWADVVLRAAGAADVLEAVDATPSSARVLVVLPPGAPALPALAALRAPGPAQRSVVTAFVSRGADERDLRADALDGLDRETVADILDGGVPPAAAGVLHDAGTTDLAVVAAWVGAAVAAGATGPRLRVRTASGTVLDVVDDVVLRARPASAPVLLPG
ncbi:hypothetical protein ACFFKU_11135 [Kineococcus gynurae]|uniref:Uncharacterized protein n=1 Tax=Kineococcus gynurae TaxID=452979 RepID=A0ABV5LUL1_9ACTN